jgi:hypothetical protein
MTRQQKRHTQRRRMQRARRENSPWLLAKRLAAMPLEDAWRYFMREAAWPQRYVTSAMMEVKL